MTAIQILTDYWRFNILAILIAIFLLTLHVISNGFRLSRKSPLFFIGIFLLLIVTLSPLNFMGHYYLFSAHMTEHIMLLLIIPPLLLAGTDADFLENLSKKHYFKKTGNILFSAPVAWLLGVGSMWVLHIPDIFHAIKQSSLLMNIQMILLLVLGTIFIWPVFAPIQWRKLVPLGSVVYLFVACVGCTVLGIFITFMPIDLYTSRMTGHDVSLLNLIQTKWGITPAIDQQIGGLIMWVPACMIYLTNIMIILGKWYLTPDTEESIKTVESDKMI